MLIPILVPIVLPRVLYNLKNNSAWLGYVQKTKRKKKELRADLTVRTSLPTRATMMEVVVEDDWKMTVARTPIMRPTGFTEKKVDWEKNFPPSLPMMRREAEDRKLSEQMKK